MTTFEFCNNNLKLPLARKSGFCLSVNCKSCYSATGAKNRTVGVLGEIQRSPGTN